MEASQSQLVVSQISASTWPVSFVIVNQNQVKFQAFGESSVTVTSDVGDILTPVGSNKGNAPVFNYTGAPNTRFAITSGTGGGTNSTMITIETGTP